MSEQQQQQRKRLWGVDGSVFNQVCLSIGKGKEREREGFRNFDDTGRIWHVYFALNDVMNDMFFLELVPTILDKLANSKLNAQ